MADILLSCLAGLMVLMAAVALWKPQPGGRWWALAVLGIAAGWLLHIWAEGRLVRNVLWSLGMVFWALAVWWEHTAKQYRTKDEQEKARRRREMSNIFR